MLLEFSLYAQFLCIGLEAAEVGLNWKSVQLDDGDGGLNTSAVSPLKRYSAQ